LPSSQGAVPATVIARGRSPRRDPDVIAIHLTEVIMSAGRLLLAAFLLWPATVRAQAPDARARAFDAYTTQAVKDWGAVGLAVAVVKDGKVVFARGYGVRELGKPAAVDTSTLFAIGSTTKAMTAAALGMLVDEGKLRWDDPVTKYLPWFQLSDPWVTRQLTVRDLLTHRAGLGNADVLWYETDLSPEEVLRRARFIPMAYSMRSSFIYQNIMYAAAGAVVASASGSPWSEFIRQRIFTPLGMSGTAITLAQAEGRANIAVPHDRINDTVQVIRNASVDAVAPAGSIWSSVADMAKWMAFMSDSGRVNGTSLLTPGTWAELVKPQTMVTAAGFYPSAQLTRPHWVTYGLGWFQQDYAGRKLDFHTGSIDGMVAIAGMIPDERFAVYVLGNLDHVEIRHALMFKAIDLWLGTGTRDWSRDLLAVYGRIRAQGDSAMAAVVKARVAGTSPSLPLEGYAGTYADSLYGSVQVKAENGGLHLIASSRLDAVLTHWHYDTFRGEWNRRWQGPFLVTFGLDARGRVDRLEIQGSTLRRR
jgi:CubicO group peptidase (beta-lactamase class C family)